MHSSFFIAVIVILVQMTNLTGYISTTDAAPTTITIPDYGILNLPNGDRYLFTKLNDAPNFGFSQWGAITSNNGLQELPTPAVQPPIDISSQPNSASTIPDNKPQEPSAPVAQQPTDSPNQAKFASIPSDNTAIDAPQTNSTATLTNFAKGALNTTRDAIRNNAGIIGTAAGTAVGAAVTAGTSTFIGPGGIAAGAAAGKMTSEKIRNTLSK
ncbi:hypothetical protein BDF19DRAFT_454255 [Syncephalis fuscata]|nr:hypothetical protein BDF19DRAFT_454255 [Syncephalis fuscata]